MDFSRFNNTIEAQKKVFDGIKDRADAQTFDNICNVLNGTLDEISVVASVLPVNSKKGLITALRSLRELAMALINYKLKFFNVNPVTEEVASEEVAPAEPVAPVTPEVPNNVVPIDSGNTMGQEQGQVMTNTNAKSLTLTNPAIPNGNVFGQFNQAA